MQRQQIWIQAALQSAETIRINSRNWPNGKLNLCNSEWCWKLPESHHPHRLAEYPFQGNIKVRLAKMGQPIMGNCLKRASMLVWWVKRGHKMVSITMRDIVELMQIICWQMTIWTIMGRLKLRRPWVKLTIGCLAITVAGNSTRRLLRGTFRTVGRKVRMCEGSDADEKREKSNLKIR